MCEELTSGFGIKKLCWLKEKGSVPPKSGKMCMSVCCSSAGISSLPPYFQEKVAGADMVRYEVITKMPKGNLHLPPGCSGTHRGKKRLPFGARAASGGEAWNSNWGVKVLVELVLSCTRKIVLISGVETFMLPFSRELQRCLNAAYGSVSWQG